MDGASFDIDAMRRAFADMMPLIIIDNHLGLNRLGLSIDCPKVGGFLTPIGIQVWQIPIILMPIFVWVAMDNDSGPTDHFRCAQPVQSRSVHAACDEDWALAVTRG